MPRSAIITGSAVGIGNAIAQRLASDGLNILVNDFPSKQDELDMLVKELEAKGVNATSYACDASNEAEVTAMVAKCVEKFGSLDVMVCNAGTAFLKPILETSLEEMEHLFDVNFGCTWVGYKCAAIQMIKQGKGGRIIGAASGAAKRGQPSMAAYAASKFAIRGLTQSAAQEWGVHNITVNTYCPGVVLTPLLEQLGASLASVTGRTDVDPKTIWANAAALGRLGEPDDIAGVVAWFASPDSAFVTGQSLLVDGGSSFD